MRTSLRLSLAVAALALALTGCGGLSRLPALTDLKAYYIPTKAMEPSLEPGDTVATWPIEGEIQRGAVVIFHQSATRA